MDSYEEVNELVSAVRPGADGLLYLPYLSGERTPHMNPNAKGVFFGMTLGQERGHFLRAVMEGVAYSLKDCLGIIQELGIDAPEIIASAEPPPPRSGSEFRRTSLANPSGRAV